MKVTRNIYFNIKVRNIQLGDRNFPTQLGIGLLTNYSRQFPTCKRRKISVLLRANLHPKTQTLACQVVWTADLAVQVTILTSIVKCEYILERDALLVGLTSGQLVTVDSNTQ